MSSRIVLSLDRFLREAIGAARALAEFHETIPVHGSLSPAWLASGLRSRRWEVWPYISPEQTGRLQRPVDARSDLYALGVILFELLTGALPFEADDPLEWVHRHLAMPPRRPRAIDAEIPDTVERVVLRLLEKDPEDRYQTADGLRHDLERCLEEWEWCHSIAPFLLGERDRSDRLLIPQKLYGRARERRTLLDALGAVCGGGGPRVVLVVGGPGVGKSALVRELAAPVAAADGLLVSGKFDEGVDGAPYAPIAVGFGELMGLILAGHEEALRDWRERLQAALGDRGRVLTDVIPQLGLVLGPQAAVPSLPAGEAHYRFTVSFRHFVGAVATREHPLVLVLDDLHWADAASLQLIAGLASDRSLGSLLVVGTYRDDAPPGRALARMRVELQESGTSIETVELGPLGAQPLTELLSDALGVDAADCEPLQAMLYEKTAGNPLFFGQLLLDLRSAGLVHFDREAHTWRWDADGIHQAAVSAEVVQLLTERLEEYPSEMRRALSLAACLGGSFDAGLVALVSADTPEETARTIDGAVRAGLLIRSRDGYRFSHDRVREAAYAAIAVEDRSSTHLRIGRTLLANRADLFVAVGQLNRGRSAVERPTERLELARLNQLAAQHARAAVAFDAVSEYCGAGLELLGADAWASEHDLAFWFTRERAEAELYIGNLEAVERLLSSGLANSSTQLERMLCARIGSDLKRTAGALIEGLEFAIDALRTYGLEISLHPTNVDDVERQMRERLAHRPVEALLELPVGTDPEIEAALDLLARAGPNAYLVDFNLHHLIACLVIHLTLEHGTFAASAWGLAAYGFDLSVAGRYEEGDRFAQVGLGLVDRHGFVTYRAFVCTLLAQLVWTRELRVAAEIARDGIRSGTENGDVLGAGFCWLMLCLDRLAAGAPLAEVEREALEGLEFVRRVRYADETDTLRFVLRLVRALRGRTDRLATLTAPECDEPGIERRLSGDAVAHIRAAFYAHILQAQVFGDDFAAALATSEKLAADLHSVPGMRMGMDAAFFGALAIAGCEPNQRQARVAQLRAHVKQLDEWARSCPQNFAHQAALVAGELARIEGRGAEALELFALAAARAQTHCFVHIEGLAHESSARLCREQGRDLPARRHISDAIDCFRQWGASGKVAQLEQLRLSYTSAGDDRGEGLDALAVANAAQAISGEVVHERLLERLLKTVIQHAGARGGALLLSREGHTIVAATAERTETGVAVTVHEPPLEPSPALVPETVVNYVSRTREPLIIGEARASSPFAADPYISGRHVRSMLCVPLLAQRELRGLMCLENDLIANAFTPDQLAALGVLASQAVISLENASLYGALRGEIAERKRYERELQYLADHDWLTGLLNRRRFREELDRELARAARTRAAGAVLLIDLDSFKYVNDSLGHSAGDELIAEAGALLARRLRRTDVLARIGGDEFAVILPDVTDGQAELVARELLEAIRSDLKVDFAGGPRPITASVGIAAFSAASDQTAEDLLIEADIAMYDSKEAGRNRASFYSSTDEHQERMQARLTWGDRIRQALEDDRLILCAQPIVALNGDPHARHEMLVRMLGNDGDLIPPAAFLPIAERIDLIDRIDRWVARETIHALAAMQRAGHELRLHVNLSPLSIADEQLPEFIANELETADAAGRGLCFEITETAAIINMDRARRFAQRIVELGCQFALDDFGSGFASFYYLKHLPFDYLKIDGEFIKELPSNPTDQLVVKSIAEIARGLGKRTIAEFVSDRETLELIKRYGVDYAQGFHISKPTPLAEIDLAQPPAIAM